MKASKKNSDALVTPSDTAEAIALSLDMEEVFRRFEDLESREAHLAMMINRLSDVAVERYTSRIGKLSKKAACGLHYELRVMAMATVTASAKGWRRLFADEPAV